MSEGGALGAGATVAGAGSDTLAHLGVEFDSLPVGSEMVVTVLGRAAEPAVKP